MKSHAQEVKPPIEGSRREANTKLVVVKANTKLVVVKADTKLVVVKVLQ